MLVIGMSGAGKTRVAREISSALGLPHIELDGLYWAANWTPRPPRDFLADVAQAVAAPRWVVDGNYASARSIVWPRATLVVWIDLPLVLHFWRVLRRTTVRIATQQPLWQGNRETLRRALFDRDSILLWVLRLHGRRRREFEGLMASQAYPSLQWLRLRNRGEVRTLLSTLPGDRP